MVTNAKSSTNGGEAEIARCSVRFSSAQLLRVTIRMLALCGETRFDSAQRLALAPVFNSSRPYSDSFPLVIGHACHRFAKQQ
jgi:hypothetical protein